MELILFCVTHTREGYHFEGWAESETASSATYQPSGSFTKNANTTLYAVWAINQYAVVANANGGLFEDGKEQKDIIYNWGMTVNLSTIPTPTRKNYEFVGWFLQDGTQYFGGVIKNHIYVWAKWKMLANCYIRKDGVYKAGMMYRRENGVYGTGSTYVRKQGEYVQNTE